MAVSLSPLAGAGWQFFDNNGIPLAGGLLYTYAAGTSTPLATYTTISGNVLNSNPIVLDSAGRVPSEIWITVGYGYKFVLQNASAVQIATWDNIPSNASSPFANDASSISYEQGNSVTAGSFIVGQSYLITSIGTTNFVAIGASSNTVGVYFTATGVGSGTGTAQTSRSVQNKLQEIVSVKDFGAKGDGTTDDTAAIQAALNAGAIEVVFPSGTYKTTGVSVGSSSTLAGIRFISGSQILLATGSNRIALDIQKQVFSIWGTADVKSNGTASDGNNTIGIRCGTTSQGLGYCRIEAIRFENFSLYGVVFYQPVYCGIERISGYSSTYGLTFLPNGSSIGGSTVEIGPSYITGCTRGIYANSCSWLTLREPVLEYSGNATSTDGALHFVTCGSVTVIDRYGEQNARNMVKIDSNVTFINGSMFTATSPDVITYSAIAFNLRGTALLQSYKLGIRRIDYDTIDNEDLVIGSNLTVPKTGGSVIFGNETFSVNSGTLTNATWTTVATIPASEYASTVNTNAFYEYVCYAGYSDLSTGFDAGTFMNGTLRSYSGSLPAWLRFNSGNIQMNVTSSSYGLAYKIVLRRVYPG